MAVVVWIVEGTWPACVDAARRHAPDAADVVLLHVTGHEAADAAHGAFAGLLGRGHPERDPGTRVEHLAAASSAPRVAPAEPEERGQASEQCRRQRPNSCGDRPSVEQASRRTCSSAGAM
ncbi:hypothetical protein ACQF36_30110 [Streptomyces sp. Marseille-Q5077]|uniref:hypothetical protein n=1 Tax=Streptomyces sp. Marseille-Q5077 TaxID=3418995 RepID=UPI003CFCA9F9